MSGVVEGAAAHLAARRDGAPAQQHVLVRQAPRLLVAVLAVAALAMLLRLRHLVGLDFDWIDGESINSFFARRLAEGGSLYAEPSPDSEAFPIYLPGYYWAITPLQAIWPGELWPQRLLSFASIAVAAACAGAIAARLGASRLLAVVSGLALFSFVSVDGVMAAARPDALAIAAAGVALLATTAWEDDRSRRALALSGASTVVMLLVKQNFAALALALLVAIAVRDRGAALRWALGVAGGAIALLAVGELTSSGAMLSSVREFGESGFSLEALTFVLEGALLPFPHPVLVAGAVTALAGLVAGGREPRAAVLAWFAGAVFVLSAAKIGSAINYFLLVDFASAALVGVGLQRVSEAGGVAVGAAATAAIALMLLPVVRGVPDSRDLGATVSTLQQQNAEAVRRIRAANGEALVTRPDLAVQAGLEPAYDPAVVASRAAAGNFDATHIASRLRRREYALVQTSFDLRGSPPRYQGIDLMPMALVAAAREGYCEAWRTPGAGGRGAAYLYRPCPGGAPSRSG